MLHDNAYLHKNTTLSKCLSRKDDLKRSTLFNRSGSLFIFSVSETPVKETRYKDNLKVYDVMIVILNKVPKQKPKKSFKILIILTETRDLVSNK